MVGLKGKSPRRYWAELAGAFALSLSVIATAPGLVWPISFLVAFVAFIVVHAIYYGQVGRHIQGRLVTATPGAGALAMLFGAGALLLRGSEIAYWAGPLLAVAGFVVMFLFLDRFGKFYQAPSRDSA
ncbi:hypothetical protein [Sinomonas sp. P47F7]|uniref:hypothetical protein n=1 Tax=Sinomonas sp. P47F7 TaxID=3410987 RepID=UPI003BF4FBB7